MTDIVSQPGTCASRVEEPGRRVAGVEDLGPGSPSLRRPLLEQAERVAVAVGHVVELRLLERGGEHDRDRVVGHAEPLGDGRDRRRVRRLVDVHRVLLGADRHLATRSHGLLGAEMGPHHDAAGYGPAQHDDDGRDDRDPGLPRRARTVARRVARSGPEASEGRPERDTDDEAGHDDQRRRPEDVDPDRGAHDQRTTASTRRIEVRRIQVPLSRIRSRRTGRGYRRRDGSPRRRCRRQRGSVLRHYLVAAQ